MYDYMRTYNKNQINAVTKVNNQIKKESDTKRSVLQENEKEIDNANGEEEVITSFNDLQQARCHWIQLAKLDLQLKVIQLTIAYVVEKFEPMRQLWTFGKNYQKEKLYNDQRFHDYCNCFQTALKMIMESVDEPRDMCKLIRNIGARHFFYNVYEPHTEEMTKLLIRSDSQ
uniref:GLOBIN domain-containing protein n=1 Tax=Loa loa TaxID=7209 RepID=A0A1I7VXL8_LOALO